MKKEVWTANIEKPPCALYGAYAERGNALIELACSYKTAAIAKRQLTVLAGKFGIELEWKR